MNRLLSSFVLLAFVSGCVGPPKGHRPTSARPVQLGPQSPELRQCLADLGRLQARYALLPDRDYGGGCSTISSVQLTGVGIPISNITAIQCPLALNLAIWTREAVQPAAKQVFGERVVRLESFGSYSCRNVKGRPQTAGTRSEHATANAVDVSGFVLADGRRITVDSGWNGTDDERRFLRSVRAAACNRFRTVLSPDFNAAHHDHFHFDLGRGPFCR